LIQSKEYENNISPTQPQSVYDNMI